jgi:hypothetical protein
VPLRLLHKPNGPVIFAPVKPQAPQPGLKTGQAVRVKGLLLVRRLLQPLVLWAYTEELLCFLFEETQSSCKEIVRKRRTCKEIVSVKQLGKEKMKRNEIACKKKLFSYPYIFIAPLFHWAPLIA